MRFAIFLLLFSAALFSVAQERSTANNTSSIHGIVIDTKTSQPLNGATVALRDLQPGGKWNSVSTASDGRFSFAGLAAGRYRLSASHNGYLDSANTHGRPQVDPTSGMLLSISLGQDVDDVVLRLTPTGVISGRIVNEREEPMPGVFVQTMKSSYRSGHREFSDARAGFTDDRGEFRVWGLAPGQYYIRATNPRSGPRGPAPAEIYVPIFYPGVTDPAQGQAVELRPGDEIGGVNFTLSLSHTVHVKGRVLASNAAPAKGAQVTLSQALGSGYSAQGETDATGKFDLSAVPLGAYLMTAELPENTESGRSLVGRMAVQVTDTGVDNFDLVVFPGATVSGHMRIEGERKVSAARISASLKPVEASDADSAPGSATVQPDGSFVFHDVSEGTYRVRLFPVPDGYYVKNAEDAGGTTVLVSHGHASPVEIRLAPGAGRIQGAVFKDKDKDKDNGEAAPSATVVLVPDGKRRSDAEYYRQTTADQSGKFLLGGVPPGDYSIFAWEDIEKDAYMDPDFIQQYEASGKPVRVEEGANLNLQVQLAAQARD